MFQKGQYITINYFQTNRNTSIVNVLPIVSSCFHGIKVKTKIWQSGTEVKQALRAVYDQSINYLIEKRERRFWKL